MCLWKGESIPQTQSNNAYLLRGSHWARHFSQSSYGDYALPEPLDQALDLEPQCFPSTMVTLGKMISARTLMESRYQPARSITLEFKWILFSWLVTAQDSPKWCGIDMVKSECIVPARDTLLCVCLERAQPTGLTIRLIFEAEVNPLCVYVILLERYQMCQQLWKRTQFTSLAIGQIFVDRSIL